MVRRSRSRAVTPEAASADMGLLARALGTQPRATVELPHLAIVATYWHSCVASVSLPALSQPMLNVRVNSDARVRCRHGARDFNYHATRGTVELLPPAADATWRASDGGFDYLTLSFVPGEHTRGVGVHAATEFEVLAADPLVRELSLAMVDTMLGSHAQDRAEILAPMTLTLLHRVKTRCQAGAVSGAPTDTSVCCAQLRHLIERLPDRCGENLTVAQLAREIGVSVTTFNERFKHATGSSPHQLLTSLRLDQVCASLSHSKETIASIALSAGFSSQSHLTAVFHKCKGLTPQQYRAAHASSGAR